ncbi:hypothetical protein TNCV_3682521 [Trichonephila clavipes]|uniref:Uncharacterized protein n=1 Tax=Trichonephila clavipes TaxID=2585209 RepID=A0A8X6UT76_TRICX|nr:hypothetical protein TNCV_3682521 [Trichonephila clavipes]
MDKPPSKLYISKILVEPLYKVAGKRQTVQHGSSIVDLLQGEEEESDSLFAEQIIRLMQAQYVDSCLSRSKIYEWIECFIHGRTSLCDDERSGHRKKEKENFKVLYDKVHIHQSWAIVGGNGKAQRPEEKPADDIITKAFSRTFRSPSPLRAGEVGFYSKRMI